MVKATNHLFNRRSEEKHKEESPLGGVHSDVSSEDDIFADLAAKEANHDIKFRTMSWQKTTLLLFGEYVCLAILALPWSYSVLGWVTGLVVQIVMGLLTWYTSYTLWQWCMKYPDARDICDIAASLFPKYPRLAYEGTSFMLLLNNIMLIGFHVFTTAKILNTLSDHSTCTVAFQGVAAIIGIVFSIPRTLKHVSFMGIFSAICMGVAIILCLVYCGIEEHPGMAPGGKMYPALGPVKTYAGFPDPAPSFVAGMNAMLNITFLWIGQILYPSFIAEMREPRDFPKALATLTAMEMVLFLLVSVVGYYYLGQYAQAPLSASFFKPEYRKSSFAFVIVPTIVIAAMYSNVTGKYLFRRLVGQDSRHMHSHTVAGWSIWLGIVVFIWGIAFVLGNVIPSMGDFLSIMSAAFDSFFGFIFWAVAYWRLNHGRLWANPLNIFLSIVNIILFLFGLFMLGPGLYTAIDSVVLDYSGNVTQPFTCADNSL